MRQPDQLLELSAGPVTLRAWEPGDLMTVEGAATDPVIPLISTVPVPYTDEAGRRFIERQRHRLQDGYGYSYALSIPESPTAVGSVGLWLRDSDRGRASVGYWVLANHRGRALASRGLEAISRFALFELAIPRLELVVEPQNLASIATAERCGFRREGVLRRYESVGSDRKDMVMYSLLEEDL